MWSKVSCLRNTRAAATYQIAYGSRRFSSFHFSPWIFLPVKQELVNWMLSQATYQTTDIWCYLQTFKPYQQQHWKEEGGSELFIFSTRSRFTRKMLILMSVQEPFCRCLHIVILTSRSTPQLLQGCKVEHIAYDQGECYQLGAEKQRLLSIVKEKLKNLHFLQTPPPSSIHWLHQASGTSSLSGPVPPNRESWLTREGTGSLDHLHIPPFQTASGKKPSKRCGSVNSLSKPLKSQPRIP